MVMILINISTDQSVTISWIVRTWVTTHDASTHFKLLFPRAYFQTRSDLARIGMQLSFPTVVPLLTRGAINPSSCLTSCNINCCIYLRASKSDFNSRMSCPACTICTKPELLSWTKVQKNFAPKLQTLSPFSKPLQCPGFETETSSIKFDSTLKINWAESLKCKQCKH